MIDITRPITTRTAPWPGDVGLQIDWNLSLSDGDNVSLSSVKLSSHLATHVDAPAHYQSGGNLAGAFDLATFLGPVSVVDLRGCEVVSAELLKVHQAAGKARVLARTLDATIDDEFVSEFAALSPGAAELLVRSGLRLYGTDAPSIDPVDSAAMSAHRVLGGVGIPILENLDLSQVEAGDYDLVALPLKLMETEAAPVRAILLPPGSLNRPG